MMRRFLLLILVPMTCLGQNFQFDHVISYEYVYGGGKFEVVDFINTANYNYGLQFLKGSFRDGKITAMVTDYQKEETHYFDARENDGTEIYSFDFVYKGTKKWPNDEYDRRVAGYDAVLTPVGDSLTAKLTIYKNKKRKKVMAEAFLKLSRSKVDFIPAGRFFMMDNMLSRQYLGYPFPAVIESVTHYFNGAEFNERKKFIKPINLTIRVPRKVYREGSPYEF